MGLDRRSARDYTLVGEDLRHLGVVDELHLARYRIGAWRFFDEIDEDEGMIFSTAALHRGSAS